MSQLRFVVNSIAVLALVAFGLSFLGRWHFMFDNLSSFRMHFLLTFGVLALIFLFNRARIWLSLTAGALVVCAAGVVPWYVTEHNEHSTTPFYSVISANVSPRNDNPSRLAALIDAEQPDILGLIEITPDYLEGLSSITSSFNYRIEMPGTGFYGLALLSKLPILDSGVRYFGAGTPPVISAIIQFDHAELEALLVHAYPPMSAKKTELRNLQLRELARYVKSSARPVLILGDLNTALWSPVYREFVSLAGLRNARRGYGIGGTWPPNEVLGVPIDHVLSTQDIQLRDFRVLHAIGSDHLPVATKVSVSAEGNQQGDPLATEKSMVDARADTKPEKDRRVVN